MKHRSNIVHLLLLALILALPLLFLWSRLVAPPGVVRGKSSALPLAGELTSEQQRAQELALADPRVQNEITGHHAEVFGVRRVVAGQYTEASRVCASADCRQVEIYLFDEDATVIAIVNLDTESVLDVLYQTGVQPGINKRLADRAINIVLEAPEVVEALGFRPLRADMAPVPGNLLKSSCERNHLCVAPNFQLGDRILWAVVDLTEDRLVGIRWTGMEPNQPGNAAPFIPEGCPTPGSVERVGWRLEYAVTGTDGLHVFNVTYNDVPVLTSVKHPEWHADYGFHGFVDTTGCSFGGGGYPIYPFGETQIVDLQDEEGAIVGFEVVQDFRMASWGDYCNYRYEPRLQFFDDGRFRIASAIYGKGCGPEVLYRAIVRIDLAVAGDENDYLSYWDGNQWTTAITETYRVPYEVRDHGPHAMSQEGYAWRVNDAAGNGYTILVDDGQYAQSRGDNPFLYFTLYHEDEGVIDLGVLGNCCYDDFRQGPDLYVDDEHIGGENVVLWYVPQMQTDAREGNYYCWTVSGEPEPETYPCMTGPTFVPSDPNEPTVAGFEVPNPVAGFETTFTNISGGIPPLTYTWDFGDGSPLSQAQYPQHTYAMTGTYTVTLTASNVFGTDTVSAPVTVESPRTHYFPVINKPDEWLP